VGSKTAGRLPLMRLNCSTIKRFPSLNNFFTLGTFHDMALVGSKTTPSGFLVSRHVEAVCARHPPPFPTHKCSTGRVT